MWPSQRSKFYDKPATPRRLKVARTAWRNAAQEHGHQSPQAYKAWNRFIYRQDKIKEQNNK
jgi:hypothetical protein